MPSASDVVQEPTEDIVAKGKGGIVALGRGKGIKFAIQRKLPIHIKVHTTTYSREWPLIVRHAE